MFSLIFSTIFNRNKRRAIGRDFARENLETMAKQQFLKLRELGLKIQVLSL